MEILEAQKLRISSLGLTLQSVTKQKQGKEAGERPGQRPGQEPGPGPGEKEGAEATTRERRESLKTSCIQIGDWAEHILGEIWQLSKGLRKFLGGEQGEGIGENVNQQVLS